MAEDLSGSPAWTTALDREGVRAIDRAAMQEYGISGVVLMENAARGLFHSAMKMLGDPSEEMKVLVACGTGNNGGDGYALARHLHNAGVDVVLAVLGEPQAGTDAAINRDVCGRMGLVEHSMLTLSSRDLGKEFRLIVDAIFGTGLDREVTGTAADVIGWINAARRPVLAADVPSGLDCDTGAILGCAVKATRTVTFVGPKIGFFSLTAQSVLGEVVTADIGAPRELVERFRLRIAPPHHQSPVHEASPPGDVHRLEE